MFTKRSRFRVRSSLLGALDEQVAGVKVYNEEILHQTMYQSKFEGTTILRRVQNAGLAPRRNIGGSSVRSGGWLGVYKKNVKAKQRFGERVVSDRVKQRAGAQFNKETYFVVRGEPQERVSLGRENCTQELALSFGGVTFFRRVIVLVIPQILISSPANSIFFLHFYWLRKTVQGGFQVFTGGALLDVYI